MTFLYRIFRRRPALPLPWRAKPWTLTGYLALVVYLANTQANKRALR